MSCDGVRRWHCLSRVFLGALVSLSASAVLVVNIERVAARLGLAEAILGLIAAIAADGPETSSATAALIRGQHSIGAGVVFGSNVFNLAALLGLSALIAGRIALHRSVVLFGGVMALWLAGVSVMAMLGAVTAPIALVLVRVVFIPYVVVSVLPARRLGRLRLPHSWVRWLSHAVLDEETELRPALHPSAGSWRNAVSIMDEVVFDASSRGRSRQVNSTVIGTVRPMVFSSV